MQLDYTGPANRNGRCREEDLGRNTSDSDTDVADEARVVLLASGFGCLHLLEAVVGITE